MSAMQIGLLALYFVTVLLLAYPLAVFLNWIDQHSKFRAYERAMSQPYRSVRERYREGEGFTCGTAPDGKVRRIDTAVPRTREGTR